MSLTRARSLYLVPAALACALVPLAGPACAGPMYRYVDEQGVTVYSRVPPPDGAATLIRPAPAPGSAEIEAAERRLTEQLESDAARRVERDTADAEAARRASEAESRARNCEIARANLAKLENLGARALIGPDGQPRRPSDAERAALIAETQRRIGDHCQ